MNPKNLASKSVMIVAGEASGDLHGSGLVRALRNLNPNLSYFGVGGTELNKAGVEIICEAEKLAVMGLTEVFSALREILLIFRLLKTEMKRRKPDLIILIDFGDFNLRLAKAAHKLQIPVFYYIPPKVWVWRKNRAKKLARYVTQTGVILPFEEQYLQKKGVNARYVGSPVLDSVTTSLGRIGFCRKYNIDPDKALVGILPGSRRKEVTFLLPVFLEAARRMQQKYSRDLAFFVPLASTLTVEDLENNGLKEYRKDLEIHIVTEDKYDMMASCDAVVAASGTVTLELAILDIPMVVAYKFSPTSYFIGKLFIDIPYFSLVNIIADKPVVTELLQDQVRPDSIEIELARILFDENVRTNMKKELEKVRRALGKSGASENAALLALETMSRG